MSEFWRRSHRSKRVGLNACISRAHGAVAASAPRGLRVRLKLAEPASWVDADALVVEPVVDLLIANASEAMRGAGTLTLSTRVEQLEGLSGSTIACGVIEVRDTGPGAVPPDIELMLRRARAKKVCSDRLATANALVSQAGGRLRVHSEAGKGACVSVYLPCSFSTSPGRQQSDGGESA
ncbi:MAG: hypothetical protein OXR73_29790 [Myxococcales bacterium]|nr:hypothetical protein [Myxococcales bacterium]